MARRRERLVLGLLLLEVGRPVAVDRLIELVWQDRLPAAPRSALHVCMSRLRTALGTSDPVNAPRVLSMNGGDAYVIEIEPETVDWVEFAAMTQTAATIGDPLDRSALLARALSLWRGPLLADVASPQLRERVGARLHALRERAVRMRIETDLAAGRHEELLGELAEQVNARPLDETLAGYLMVALHRCGRRAEALAVYRTTRERIVEELGLDTGESLTDLHQAILRGEPSLDPPVRDRVAKPISVRAEPVAIRTEPIGAELFAGGMAAALGVDRPARPVLLPAAVAGFVGRGDYLARLDRALAEESTSTVVICAISGAGGVGKTALALHWAHRSAGRFPDGQLYIDLGGWARTPPLPPLAALSFLLGALGLPSERIPTDPDAAAARYRSTLAGRRVLIILDNAASAEQVRPLLPGAGPSVVVVTSRDCLVGLVASHGARQLDMDVLTGEESRALIAGIAGPDRVAGEPAAAATLVELCGRLPLALRIAAAHLATQSGVSLAEYVTQLGQRDRVMALSISGDQRMAVAAAFDLSYARLPPAQRRMFRMLGRVPRVHVTADAAAALTGTDAARAERLLNHLATGHLVDQDDTGRFGMHDLMRLYAARQGEREDSAAARATATARLYRWYSLMADAAAAAFAPHIPRLASDGGYAVAPRFCSPAGALDWLDRERHNLVTIVRHAVAEGQLRQAVQLCDALRGYLVMRRHSVDLVQIGTAVLAAAAAGADLPAQAVARLALGSAEYAQDRPGDAVAHHRAACELAKACRWDAGASAALSSLGTLHWELGDLDQAASHFADALAIEQRTDRPAAQARLLARAGFIDVDRGRYRRAADHFHDALTIDQQIGFDQGQAIDHNSLGYTMHALGSPRAAGEHLRQALALARAANNKGAEASILDNLAAVHRDSGHLDTALDYATSAAAIAKEIHAERFTADALNTLATIWLALGEHQQAIEGHQQAQTIARATGSVAAQVQAHLGLSHALIGTGRPDLALDDAEQARTIAVNAGYAGLHGHALTALALAQLRLGDDQAAVDTARAGRDIHRRTGHRLGLARTLDILAEALDNAGQHTLARNARRQARRRYAQISAPDP